MLRPVPPAQPLSTAEQFALDVLVDLSRLVVSESGDGVELHVVGERSQPTLQDIRARKWAIEPRDGRVEMERGVLSLVANIVGAVDEQRSSESDRYERVPPHVNTLVHHAEERDPVVNRVANGLHYTVRAAAGTRRVVLLSPWPDGKRWAMAMTHDLDVVDFWPAYSALRIGQLLSHGDLPRAVAVAASAGPALLGNPVHRAAEHILDVERRHGIKSTWFVIAGTPTLASLRAGDVTYAPESSTARQVVGAATRQGHEIGLHGSFASFTHRDVFETQRARLAAIAGQPSVGVRQHFIRMRPGRSHAAMAAAGFAYDSTFGFSERNGFRLGVADVVPVWSDNEQRVLPIDAAPFIWMDRALSKHQHVEDPRAWITDAIATAGTCRDVSGLWTGIWHPNMTAALGFPGAAAQFERLCELLMQDAPWPTTLSGAVAWRRARRQARAVGVDASGAVRLRQGTTGPAPVGLENDQGKPIPHVAA